MENIIRQISEPNLDMLGTYISMHTVKIFLSGIFIKKDLRTLKTVKYYTDKCLIKTILMRVVAV